MLNSARLSLGLVVCLLPLSGQVKSQRRPELWAAIGVAEPLVIEDPDHDLNITFALVNDGTKVADTNFASWEILINDQKVPESGFIFGNGPGPVGGWGSLPSGEFFLFGKGLRMGKYFSKPGIYQVTWKGAKFRAIPVVVRVLPRRK
jgi:hypothetical protein